MAKKTHETYTVRYVHKVRSDDTDVGANVTLADGVFDDAKTLGWILRKTGVLMKGARVREYHRESNRVVVFPTVPGLSTYWHAVVLTITPWQSPRLADGSIDYAGIGRQIDSMTQSERAAFIDTFRGCTDTHMATLVTYATFKHSARCETDRDCYRIQELNARTVHDREIAKQFQWRP